MPCLIELSDQADDAPQAAAAIDGAILQAVIDAALVDEGEGDEQWQLGVILVSAADSAAIHRDQFAVDGSTDVMSFPDGSINPENERRLVGEVVVCPAVAVAALSERGVAAAESQALGHELILYILHGTLHCLGYDDIDEDDRRAMWARQNELLAPHGIIVRDEP